MMNIDENNINEFLNYLGFKLKEGEENTFLKIFPKFKNFRIEIKINKDNFKSSKIVYGKDIRKDRETSSNFSQKENFVILECVNRLIEQGYNPNRIYLEKYYQTGRSGSGGFLDIQILDNQNKSFLMIECKTFGKEFDKEENKIYEDGGQLFSYFNQDTKTQYLCLYSSYFENYEIRYKNNIIKITDKIKKSSNRQEAYENWKPQIFEKRGIFGKDIKPYFIEFKGLTKKDLKPLTNRDVSNINKEDKRDIFNRFAEILRRNVISDKTNSYNKIFNLFLCKIVDESERKDNEKLKFQWEENETNEEVLLRLNELYKRGMEHYLKLKISAVDIKDFEERLNKLKDEKDKKEIEEMFIRQKLYTSNDFAFREIFDKNTFDLNSDVVKEVVKLLEEFQIKYKTKQQFLGDFFEKLLNTGIKQEVGQFFTPVPIAQFVCKSLPIREIIKNKNKDEDINILPYVIDYASGSGHFLTEFMEEVDSSIKNIGDDFFENQKAKKEFNKYKNDFDWAQEYIYGIEKDYRLAKTTKVATYLNGDGDAQIILGDGLDNFYKSKDYIGILKSNENKKDLEKFDVVVANPPYSVSGFKTTLKFGKESFDLFDKFTDKSREIECLFVERTKQLLKKGGVAGVVLPISILTNSGIYTLTRELLLQNFEIKGIVEFGSNTFMATGQNTIILFLRKIENKRENILYYLEKSIKEKKDNVINNISEPIKKFLENSYKIGLDEYMEFFRNEDINNKKLKDTEIYKDYVNEFKKQNKIKNLKDFVKNKELDKLLYFVLTYNKKVVISNIPTNIKEERQFLGYEFSNRKGQEGIKIFQLGGKMYNPRDLFDSQKLNYYILKNFNDEEILETHPEATSVKVINLSDCMDFRYSNFQKTINLNKQEEIKSKYPKDNLKNIFPEIKNGADVKQEDTPQKYRVSRIETISDKKINLNKTKWTNENVNEEDFLKEGDILMSHINSMEHIGKSALFSGIKEKVIHGINTLRFRTNREDLKKKYLYLFFQYPHFIRILRSYAQKAIHQASIRISDIQKIEIPIPPRNIQDKIIQESEKLQKKQEELEQKNSELNKKILNLFEDVSYNNINQNSKILERIDVLIKNENIGDGTTAPKREYFVNGKYPFIRAENLNFKNEIGEIIPLSYNYINQNAVDNLNLKKCLRGTILFAKSGKSSEKNNVGILNQEGYIVNHLAYLYDEDFSKIKYIYYILKKFGTSNLINNKSGYPSINLEDIKKLKIPYDVKNKDKIISEVEKYEKEIIVNNRRINDLIQKRGEIIKKYLIED